MDLGLLITAITMAGGYYLSKDGKESREIQETIKNIPEEQKPSMDNTYRSTYSKKTREIEKQHATDSYNKAIDPSIGNVIPYAYNTLGSVSDQKKREQADIERRRQLHGRKMNKIEKKFINTGGIQEMAVEQSPMFNPLGAGLNSFTKRDVTQDPRLPVTNSGFGPDGISQPEDRKLFSADDRKGFGTQTKMEHFTGYTVHGPHNSTDPNFHNNMVPFFGSKATQNTDPEAWSRKLEMFTGQTGNSTELRAKPKREIPSLYDLTPGQTYVYGTPVDNAYQRDRHWTSQNKNKIAPTEQVRVGPGVGYGADATPRDGFHSSFRPLCKNVDELRVNPKQTYKGRVLPGKEQVQNRGLQGQTFKRRPDTFYINDPDRWFKTTGAYTGDKVRENFVAWKQNREDTSINYTGNAFNQDIHKPKTTTHLQGETDNDCTVSSEVQHTRRNQFRQAPPRNFHADGHAQPDFDYSKESFVAYGGERDTTEAALGAQRSNIHINQGNRKYQYDKAKPTTRQTVNIKDYVGVAGHKESLKTQHHLYDQAKTTTRQTVNVKDYVGNANTNENLKTTKYLYDQAKPTTRQTVNVKDYIGNAGNKENQKARKYLYDEAKPTTRQTVNVKDYMGVVGNKENFKTQKYTYDQAKPTTRQTLNVKDYMGVAGNKENQRARKYLYDEARPTTRQTVNVKDYFGGAEAVPTNIKPKSYENIYNATTNNNMESLLESRIYGPNKSTNVAAGACDVNMQIKDRTGYDANCYGLLGDKQYTITTHTEQAVQNATSNDQRGQEGIRQPIDYLVDAHRENPYTQSLSSAPRLQ